MPRPPAKSQSPSCTVDAEGKEICKRFVLGRCKLTMPFLPHLPDPSTFRQSLWPEAYR